MSQGRPVFTTPRFWLGVFGLALVFVYAMNAFSRTSPGPVSRVHGGVAGLASQSSCSDCHGGWFGDMTSSCLECHGPIREQIDAGRGLHGAQDQAMVQKCGLCHSEHHGEDFAIVNDRSFALAGFGGFAAEDGTRSFDHARLTNWELTGAHDSAECSACHQLAEVEVLEQGQHRFLGLQQTCSVCHEQDHQDAHEGRMVRDCRECHGQDSWDAYEPRGHERVLELTGGHEGLDCTTCHETGSARDLLVVGTVRGRAQARECIDCHDSPHQEELVTQVALQNDHTFGRACTICHTPEQTDFRDERVLGSMQAERHAATGFALAAPHDEADCSACHDPGSPYAERHPGRTQTSCAACHEDVHRGEFDERTFAAEGCVSCHAMTHFDPPLFDAAMHERTGFPIDGAHAEQDCRSCHVPGTGAEIPHFSDADARCETCHDDAHRGAFDSVLAAAPLADVTVRSGSCSHCHDTTGFANGAREDFDHARFTEFAILGAHAQASCETCHEPSPEPDEYGRRFGRVADHFGEFRGCATCHDDPHGGDFDREGLPERVEGRSDCARCHQETSFRALHGQFDHGTWTGFALTGVHALRCSECHAPEDEPTREGRTFERAWGGRCADCHQDPHAGQFDRNQEPADCARCHGTETDFKTLRFRHDTHSRFDLGEQHADVACGACHQPVEVNGQSVTRYRPLPTQCADCHGNAGSPFRRRNRSRRSGR